jgi:phosphorylcholine metabolism protein LicD
MDTKKTMSQIIWDSTEDYICWFNFEKFQQRKLRDLSNRRICAQNLLDIKKVCDKYDKPFFLMFGTLLGAIRDKEFIRTDTDTDIGFFLESKKGFYKVVQELATMDFELIRTSNEDKLVTLLRDDEYVDFCFFSKGDLPFKNLIEYPFIGSTFFVPENYEYVLGELYGDWHKVDNGRHGGPNILYGLH